MDAPAAVGALEPAAPHCPNCGETEPKHPNVAKGCYVFWGERNLPADEWYWENERAKAIYCALPGGDAGAPPPALCVMCGEAQAVLVTEPEEARWGAGPLVTIASPKYRCHACGEAWYTADQADRNFAALFKATIAALESQLATERLSRETAEREREDLRQEIAGLAEYAPLLRRLLAMTVSIIGSDRPPHDLIRPVMGRGRMQELHDRLAAIPVANQLHGQNDSAAAPPEEPAILPRIIADPRVPLGEIEMRDGRSGKLLGKIVNIDLAAPMHPEAAAVDRSRSSTDAATALTPPIPPRADHPGETSR